MRSSAASVVNRCASQQRLFSTKPPPTALLSSTSSNDHCISHSAQKHQLIKLSKRSYSVRLAEVGRFESVQKDQNLYQPGQPFLHRIFGYRGVTLFPWLAQVHDVDVRKQGIGSSHDDEKNHHTSESHKNNTGDTSSSYNEFTSVGQDDASNVDHEATTTPSSRRTAPQIHPYYQVLIDTRDCPYVSNRTQTEAVTFLGHPDNSKSVYSIKGLDYVAHEDILPYTSYEDAPISHELHSKLFNFDPDYVKNGKKSVREPHCSRFVPSELLDEWRSKHPWLELSKIYRETTENIRVTVIPFYLGHTTIEDTSFHWWRYCVRLENFSDFNVQLRERHWKIFSQTNMLQTIKGRGVVGVEPLFTKTDPAYQYSSHVNLQDKSGHMWGTFKMQRVEDGRTFDCKIPTFSLESSFSNSSDDSK